MTNALTVFNFEANEVRTNTDSNGDVWFVASDICKALGVASGKDAVARLDEDERGRLVAYTLGGNQEVVTINESGLYSLILLTNRETK